MYSKKSDLVNRERFIALLEGVLILSLIQLVFIIFLARYGAETAICFSIYFSALVFAVSLVVLVVYIIKKTIEERKKK